MDYESCLSMEPSDGERMALVRLLNKQLADTLDLRSQARQSYFNARGPYGQELRSLFDGLARDLRCFADLIADRIVGAGGYAVATVRSVAHESGLRDYPVDVLNSHDQLAALLSSYSRYELVTGHNLKAVQEIGDPPTAEILQLISVSIEHELWFLEAYLEGIAVGLHGRKLPVWTSTLSNHRRTHRGESAASSGVA